MRAFSTLFVLFFTILLFVHTEAEAQTNAYSDKKRMELFKSIENNFQIPWFYMAAIDQYEHSIRNARRDLPDSSGSIGILIPPEKWSGLLNPNLHDQNPKRIAFLKVWG